MILLTGFFFFFFKQKTAYEMRISDWSSDVCSSDLRRFAPMIRALKDDDGLSEAESGFVAMLVNRLQERESIASGKLSRREIEVLRTLEAGGSDKQLARQLGLGSEERRVGEECVSTCRSRGSP